MDQDTDELLFDVPLEVKDPGWNIGPNARVIEQTVHWKVSLSTGWESMITAPNVGQHNRTARLLQVQQQQLHQNNYNRTAQTTAANALTMAYRKQSANFKVGNNDQYKAYIVLCKSEQSQARRMSIYLNFVEWKTSIVGKLSFRITDQQQFHIQKELPISNDTHKSGQGWGIENFFENSSPYIGMAGTHYGYTGMVQQNATCLQVRITLRLEVENAPGSISPIKNHLDELANHLGSLYEGGRFADVMLLVDGRLLRAHKAVLCARSPVFAAMLVSDMAEAAMDSVQIEDLQVEVVEKMLKFMYTGRVDGLGEVAEDLLTAADKYGLDSLKDLCAEWLTGNLTTLNAAQIFRRADLHSVAGLQKTAAIFIKSNMIAVTATDGWKALKKACPQLVIDTFIEM